MLKARIFNIMQYVNHPETGEPLLDEDRIKATIEKKSVKQWAYVLHDKDVFSAADEEADPNHKQGNVKPPHWHIVLQCGYAVEVGTIAKWLGIGENFVDVPKGNGPGKFLDCVEYLTHESVKQQELGKHRYDDAEIRSNFDFRARLDKRNENKAKYGRDLDESEQMMYDVMYKGKTLKQCMAQNEILYMKLCDKLQKMRLQYLSHQDPPTQRLNFYVCGEGGTGKGLMSRALARSMFSQYEDDDDIFFEAGSKNAIFEGYDGQPVIIWNDFRAGDLLAGLGGRGNVFNIFDTHPTRQRQNVKFSSVRLCNQVNIVNSVQPYFDFLNGLAGEYTDKDGNEYKAEDKGQAYRRFPFIIPIHKHDFDILLNRGFIEDTDDFAEYLAYKRVAGSLKDIRIACGDRVKLAQEIESKTIQPIMDKVEEARGKVRGTQRDKDDDDIRGMFSQNGSSQDIPEDERRPMESVSDWIDRVTAGGEEIPFD